MAKSRGRSRVAQSAVQSDVETEQLDEQLEDEGFDDADALDAEDDVAEGQQVESAEQAAPQEDVADEVVTVEQVGDLSAAQIEDAPAQQPVVDGLSKVNVLQNILRSDEALYRYYRTNKGFNDAIKLVQRLLISGKL